MKAETLQNQSKLAEPAQGLFNSKKLFSQALRYWYLYLLSLLICVSYGWFKVHYATPMYKVYGQIMVQDDKSGGSSAQALNGNGRYYQYYCSYNPLIIHESRNFAESIKVSRAGSGFV